MNEAPNSRLIKCLLEARIPGFDELYESMLTEARGVVVRDDLGELRAPLRKLNLAQQDNFAVSLFRTWAVVGEILSFYQDRLADEGYLATATDPDSLWKLLRLIGSGPAPWPSSTAHVDFTAAAQPGLNVPLVVPKGTSVRGISVAGQISQTYETSEEIQVHADWNEVPLRIISRPSTITEVSHGILSLTFQGIHTGLKPGGQLVFLPRTVLANPSTAPFPYPPAWLPTALTVVEDVPTQTTTVGWQGDAAQYVTLGKFPHVFAVDRAESLYGYRAPLWESLSPAIQLQQGGTLGGGVSIWDPATGLWSSFQSNLPLVPEGAMPLNATIVTPSGQWVGATNVGVVLADDDGWQLSTTGLTFPEITALAAAPDGTLFAGTSAGSVFRSSDEGAHWDPVGGIIKVTYTPDVDGKGTWTPLSSSLPSAVIRQLAVVETDSGIELVAATDVGIYWSDGEQSGWTKDPEPVDPSTVAPQKPLEMASPLQAWVVCGNGKTLLAASGDLFYLRDAGGGWQKVGATPAHKLVRDLCVFDAGLTNFACSTEDGIFLSGDGGKTWEPAQAGLPAGIVPTIAVQERSKLLAAGNGEIWIWDDMGEAWKEFLPTAPTDVGILIAGRGGALMAVTPSRGILETDWPTATPVANQIDLSRIVSTIVPGTILLLDQEIEPGEHVQGVFGVSQSDKAQRDDMLQSADVSRLTLPGAGVDKLDRFYYRDTVVYPIASRLLQAQVITKDALCIPKGRRLYLARRIAEQLAPGRKILVTGKPPRIPASKGPLDGPAPGIPSVVFPEPFDYSHQPPLDLLPALPEDNSLTEVAHIESMVAGPPGESLPWTLVTLKKPLKNLYDPRTVRVSLNAVEVTHGQTVTDETLGDGDPKVANQSFALKKGPLAFLPGDPPVSTLEVRVNGVVWKEVASPNQMTPASQTYFVRLNADQSGVVIFGDGTNGARLPAGRGNVTATYRVADANAGEIKRSNLAFWDRKPTGLERVTNPAGTDVPPPPPSPRQVATRRGRVLSAMERAISTEDLTALARGRNGVADAESRRVWAPGGDVVIVSIAESVPSKHFPAKEYETYFNERKGFPLPVFALPTTPVPFALLATVIVDNEDSAKSLQASLPVSLDAQFGYPNWPIGRNLYRSDVIAFLQSMKGILGVDLLLLSRLNSPASPTTDDLVAVLPVPGAGGQRRRGVEIFTLWPKCTVDRDGLTLTVRNLPYG